MRSPAPHKFTHTVRQIDQMSVFLRNSPVQAQKSSFVLYVGHHVASTVSSLITANEMQMRTPIFGQIRAQMVVRIDCAHVMRMQKSGCINVAENRTSGTNVRARSATVRILYHTHVL